MARPLKAPKVHKPEEGFDAERQRRLDDYLNEILRRTDKLRQDKFTIFGIAAKAHSLFNELKMPPHRFRSWLTKNTSINLTEYERYQRVSVHFGDDLDDALKYFSWDALYFMVRVLDCNEGLSAAVLRARIRVEAEQQGFERFPGNPRRAREVIEAVVRTMRWQMPTAPTTGPRGWPEVPTQALYEVLRATQTAKRSRAFRAAETALRVGYEEGALLAMPEDIKRILEVR